MRPDGTVVDLNRPAAELLGIDPESAPGRPLRDVQQRGRHLGRGNRVRRSSLPRRLTPVSRSRENASRARSWASAGPGRRPSLWVRISAEPLLSPAGDLEAVVLTLVDVTGSKEAGTPCTTRWTNSAACIETLPDTYVYVDADDLVRRVIGARNAAPGVPGHPRRRRSRRAGLGEPVGGRGRPHPQRRRACARHRQAGHRRDRHRHADGHPLRRGPSRARDGGTLLLIARDITESRRAAEALRQSEEKYRTLYLRTPVMLHSIDAEGRLLSVSDRWLQRLGYTADEVLGRRAVEFMTEESRRFANEEGLPSFFATGSLEDLALQFVAKDGSVVDVLLSATSERDANGAVLRSLSVLIDVTEQRRALRELAEQDRTMRTLLANVPGMAYRCANDADWTALVLSQGCRDLTGYDADELLGPGELTYGSLLDPADRRTLRKAVESGIASHEPWTITYSITTRDGLSKWVWERGVGIYGETGPCSSLRGS